MAQSQHLARLHPLILQTKSTASPLHDRARRGLGGGYHAGTHELHSADQMLAFLALVAYWGITKAMSA